MYGTPILHWAISYIDYLVGSSSNGWFCNCWYRRLFSSGLKERRISGGICGSPSGLEGEFSVRLIEPEVDEVWTQVLRTVHQAQAEGLFLCQLGMFGQCCTGLHMTSCDKRWKRLASSLLLYCPDSLRNRTEQKHRQQTWQKRPMLGKLETSLGSEGCFAGVTETVQFQQWFLWHCRYPAWRGPEKLWVQT